MISPTVSPARATPPGCLACARAPKVACRTRTALATLARMTSTVADLLPAPGLRVIGGSLELQGIGRDTGEQEQP